MESLSPKERLQRALGKKSVDRPPVICPGGMMNSATVEVMKACDQKFPQANRSAEMMSRLAREVHLRSGFENFGIPFCMTVEAEVLGSEIHFGSLSCEPKIQKEVFAGVAAVRRRDTAHMLGEGRVPTVLDAIYSLHGKYPDVPVVGSLTGPVSTAASIVDPMCFLKELRKDKAGSHACIQYVTDFLVAYAQAMVESGAGIITIADPTATGEILGPKMFEEYAVAYINQLADAIHGAGAQVIVHICGKMDAVKRCIPLLRADAVSTDAMVNLAQLKQEFPQLTTMGNLSTFSLQNQEPEKISEHTRRLLKSGVEIIAPACGLSTTTPTQNIRAMTDAVKYA